MASNQKIPDVQKKQENMIHNKEEKKETIKTNLK